jgi:hypothetical protein
MTFEAMGFTLQYPHHGKQMASNENSNPDHGTNSSLSGIWDLVSEKTPKVSDFLRRLGPRILLFEIRMNYQFF